MNIFSLNRYFWVGWKLNSCTNFYFHSRVKACKCYFWYDILGVDGRCHVLRFISFQICFMERNGHSCLIESLKAKLNMCALIFSFFSFCLPMSYMCFMYVLNIECVCIYSLSYKCTSYRLLDWKAILEDIQLRLIKSLWIHIDPAEVSLTTESTLF